MSQRLINRSDDLRRLREEGYNVQIRSGHLILDEIPYINGKREEKKGTLISVLNLSGDMTRKPDNHIVYFAGEYPCYKDGTTIPAITHETLTGDRQVLAQDIRVNYSFSNKPPAGFENYYDKMTSYINIISGPAISLNPDATPKTFPVVATEEEDSVFNYVETASSRAGITAITERLADTKVAIVGLGGTGAYILDFLAKTPVRVIDLYDGDFFLSHNAFRAPGAASLEALRSRPRKVDHYNEVYSQMRKNGIVPHPYNIDASNVNDLDSVQFVFLCIDGGQSKKVIVDHLQERGIQFIDCGIGVNAVNGKLSGLVRTTISTVDRVDHISKCIPFGDVDDEYSQNIQIAELNGLNAALAVIKWKKLMGFYHDLEGEHQMVYAISGNALINEEGDEKNQQNTP